MILFVLHFIEDSIILLLMKVIDFMWVIAKKIINKFELLFVLIIIIYIYLHPLLKSSWGD